MTITLALESAIAGGSVSLLDGERELDHWIGRADVSRAEDLLLNIDALLGNHGLTAHDLDLLAVSAGPGSFTGIRIGIATALGLKSGLQVPTATVSALDAIAAASAGEKITVAVPLGRNFVCVQEFAYARAEGVPVAVDFERFIKMVEQNPNDRYVAHEKLCSDGFRPANVVNFGANVAKAVGSFAVSNPDAAARPMFISKAAK